MPIAIEIVATVILAFATAESAGAPVAAMGFVAAAAVASSTTVTAAMAFGKGGSWAAECQENSGE
jgi:hypothetical protein